MSAQSPTPLLEARAVYAGYGETSVLEGMTFAVPPGSCVVLLGPNGVGKSTTLRVVSGVIKPTSGSVVYKGADLQKVRDYRIARLGLAHVPEGRGIFPGLTVRDNLRIGAFAQQSRRRELSTSMGRVFSLFPVLSEKADHAAASLSGGQQQMLAIGRGLMGTPELLLLDEPSLGLSPLLVDQVFDALASIKSQGMTILLVEQNAQHALALADYVYVIGEGHVVNEGTPDQVRDTLDVDYLA